MLSDLSSGRLIPSPILNSDNHFSKFLIVGVAGALFFLFFALLLDCFLLLLGFVIYIKSTSFNAWLVWWVPSRLVQVVPENFILASLFICEIIWNYNTRSFQFFTMFQDLKFFQISNKFHLQRVFSLSSQSKYYSNWKRAPWHLKSSWTLCKPLRRRRAGL